MTNSCAPLTVKAGEREKARSPAIFCLEPIAKRDYDSGINYAGLNRTKARIDTIINGILTDMDFNGID